MTGVGAAADSDRLLPDAGLFGDGLRRDGYGGDRGCASTEQEPAGDEHSTEEGHDAACPPTARSRDRRVGFTSAGPAIGPRRWGHGSPVGSLAINRSRRIRALCRVPQVRLALRMVHR
jgi:hypothetical protein